MLNFHIPLKNTPQWTGQSRSPVYLDYTKGYDVVAGRLSPAKRARADTFANGSLAANFANGSPYQFPLFVHDVSLTMGLAGNQAQSQTVRDFYPHNILMPAMKVSGKCYDQYSYGMLCEFISAAQRQFFAPNVDLPCMQLYIAGNIYPLANGTRRNGAGVPCVRRNGKGYANQIIKGQHNPLLALGYIMSTPREHNAGDYAPDWDLQFTVANMLAGPYTDGLAPNVAQQTWADFLTGSGAVMWNSKANKAENIKDKQWVADNADSTFNQYVNPSS